MSHRSLSTVLVILFAAAWSAPGGARAGDLPLDRAMEAAVTAVPGWVLSAERGGPGAPIRVLVVDVDGAVQRLDVDAADGAVAGQDPYGGDRARDYAARVLAASGGTPPDLTALVKRMVQMTRGCPVVEAELENHRDTVVAEVECRHGDVEVELVFDPTNGAVIGLEVEREGEADEPDDELEDEPDDELEDEIEAELEDETRTN